MFTSNKSRIAAATTTTFLLFVLTTTTTTNAFNPSSFAIRTPIDAVNLLQMKMSSNDGNDNGNVSGSFFNSVPDNKDENGDKEEDKNANKGTNNDVGGNGKEGSADPFDFDLGMSELMRKRSKKPLASKPSTIGGIPTSQAKGFGKSTTKGPQIINTSATQASVIEPSGRSKPLNDVNNPEYDDQGYTLYANEKTGEKSRVFEALIDYPCEFKMKIIGANDGSFAKEMVQIVADSCNAEVDTVKFSERVNGKWTSVTVFAPVESAEMLYALYENVDRDPRVKFKF